MKNSKKFLREMAVKIRLALGVETIEVTELCTRARRDELRRVTTERMAATATLRTKLLSGPQARYDAEYGTADELTASTGTTYQFEGTHYWFWSPILETDVLRSILLMSESRIAPCRILSDDENRISQSRIMDVGCGNGTLLRAILSLGASKLQLLGVDISRKAIERVSETTPGVQGRLQDQGFGNGSFDTIFLSYFVDREGKQKETFRAARDFLKIGGLIVLEGLFPCILKDSQGRDYGPANVTKGNDALEDIKLVVAEFSGLGVTLKKVFVGWRLVCSLDGPEVLPCYILVSEKN